MYSPPASRESILSDGIDPFTRAYRDVVIYADVDSEEVLHEGPIVVHANGWIELEGGRLLSPSAIHHIDVYDEAEPASTDDASREDRRRSDDDGGSDGRRTNRFSPR